MTRNRGPGRTLEPAPVRCDTMSERRVSAATPTPRFSPASSTRHIWTQNDDRVLEEMPDKEALDVRAHGVDPARGGRQVHGRRAVKITVSHSRPDRGSLISGMGTGAGDRGAMPNSPRALEAGSWTGDRSRIGESIPGDEPRHLLWASRGADRPEVGGRYEGTRIDVAGGRPACAGCRGRGGPGRHGGPGAHRWGAGAGGHRRSRRSRHHEHRPGSDDSRARQRRRSGVHRVLQYRWRRPAR